MRIAKYDYEAMPRETRNLYLLMMDKTAGGQTAFAQELDVRQQPLTRLYRPDPRNGRYPAISPEIKEKVCRRYGLDQSFFLAETESSRRNTDQTRPRIDQTASAGKLTEEIDVSYERYPVIKQLPDYDFTILVKGDSMEPEIKSGDELACRVVTDASFIQWGKVHVLDTDQGIVVQRIYDDTDGLKCVSDNPKYLPFTEPKDQLRSVCLVVGLVRF